jgi:hypothetical protein
MGVAALMVLASLGGRVEADPAFRCELTAASGLSPSDAGTAAQMICDELKRASGGRGAFGITLTTLGRMVVVTAAREGTAEPVTVRVDTIEEVPLAAPRIAQALVHGEPFAATQRVDNLLPVETRPALTKKGSIKFTLGVADIESAGHGGRAAGFSFGMAYATPKFALPAEMRFGWDDSNYGEPGLSLFSISVGGRYYLSNRNVSPFVGGGLGVLNLHARDGEYPDYPNPDPRSDYFDAERFGVAPYLEVGVEMLRLHRGRVALHVRADFPTGSLTQEEYEVYTYDPRTRRDRVDYVVPAASRYVVPVTIGLTVAF